MKIYHINSKEAIKEFFADIQSRYKQPFDPIDDLSLLTTENGQSLFSEEEAAYMDDVMLNCFVYCADHRLDIHDIAEEVHQELYCFSPWLAATA
jgi:hypothetical protein